MTDDTKLEGISHPIALENEEQGGSRPEPEKEVKKDMAEEGVKPESETSQEVEKFLMDAQQNGDISPSPETSMWTWAEYTSFPKLRNYKAVWSVLISITYLCFLNHSPFILEVNVYHLLQAN